MLLFGYYSVIFYLIVKIFVEVIVFYWCVFDVVEIMWFDGLYGKVWYVEI